MRLASFARCLILLSAAALTQPAAAAVDCRTPEGQLALMMARVVVGVPQSPAELPAASNLPFRATSELFRVAQDETSSSTCYRFLKAWVYVSKSSSALSALPTIASSAKSDTWTAPNVTAGQLTIGRSGNVLTFNGAISRIVPAGTTLYYRFGKQIVKEGAVDPFVFSTTYSFRVPAAPVAPVLPNLVPQPTLSSNTNRALFRPAGGSFGANGESFLRVPDRFCPNILASGTQDGTYPCGTNGTCRKLRMSVALTPVVYFARNAGQAAADSSSGTFQIVLQRSELVNGVPTKLTPVATGISKRVEPGANSPQFTFNPARTVTVYGFPDDNPGACFGRCEPNLPGCTLAYQELEYKVVVDGGNSSQGEVLESNEIDDEGSPMGSL